MILSLPLSTLALSHSFSLTLSLSLFPSFRALPLRQTPFLSIQLSDCFCFILAAHTLFMQLKFLLVRPSEFIFFYVHFYQLRSLSNFYIFISASLLRAKTLLKMFIGGGCLRSSWVNIIQTENAAAHNVKHKARSSNKQKKKKKKQKTNKEQSFVRLLNGWWKVKYCMHTPQAEDEKRKKIQSNLMTCTEYRRKEVGGIDYASHLLCTADCSPTLQGLHRGWFFCCLMRQIFGYSDSWWKRDKNHVYQKLGLRPKNRVDGTKFERNS